MSILHEVFNTEESRLNFILGCIRVSKCNKKFHEKERNFIIRSSLALEVNEKSGEKIDKAMANDFERMDLEFSTRQQKILFIKEMIDLCYYDGSYDSVEKEEISIIAKGFDLLESTVNEIEQWILEGIEWNKKGEKILNA